MRLYDPKQASSLLPNGMPFEMKDFNQSTLDSFWARICVFCIVLGFVGSHWGKIRNRRQVRSSVLLGKWIFAWGLVDFCSIFFQHWNIIQKRTHWCRAGGKPSTWFPPGTRRAVHWIANFIFWGVSKCALQIEDNILKIQRMLILAKETNEITISWRAYFSGKRQFWT